MKKVLFSILTLGALVSCSSEEVLDNAGNDKVEIKLNAGVITTKAPIESDGSGNPSVKVDNVQFLRSDGTADWTTLTSATFTGTIETTQVITVAEGKTQYYPIDGTNTNILGFYPAATSIATGKASFTIDGSQDIIYATPVSGSKSSAIGNLQFAHKLTQFKFVLKRDNSGSSDISNVVVSVKSANSTFDMDLADGTLSTWATPITTIKPIDGGTATIAGSSESQGIMLEPELSSIVLSVSATGFPDQEITIDGTDGGKFETGKAYTLTLTFKAKTIAGEASIANWQEGTAGGSDIN